MARRVADNYIHDETPLVLSLLPTKHDMELQKMENKKLKKKNKKNKGKGKK